MKWIVGQRVFAELEPELGLGVVAQVIGDRLLEIAFPGVSLSRRYTQRGAPLRRLMVSPSQKVRSKKGDLHVVAEVREVGGLLILTSNEGIEIWEYELDHIIEDETPIARFLHGQWASPRTFALRRDAWAIRSKSLDPSLRGLVGCRISLLPHQLSIAAEVSRREFPRVLLADEVGLGKTIEAGMIFSSLRALGRAARVLVVVPEALEHQWLAEMYRRFNEMFALVDEARCEQEELSQGSSAFEMNQRILCSLTFLEQNLDRLQEAAEQDWDLLIVDEAHRLGWSAEESSVRWDIIKLLASRSSGVLLLTATPQREGLETQFGLLNIVDNHRFSDFEQFKKQTGRMKEVAAIARRVSDEDRSPALLSELRSLFKADKDLVQTAESYMAGAPPTELLRRLVDRHGTGRVLIRNRRTRIQGFPERKVELRPLAAPAAWKKWLAAADVDDWDDEKLYGLAAGLDDRRGAPGQEWFASRAADLLAFLSSVKNEKVLLICSSPERVHLLQEWLRTRSTIRTAAFDEDLEIVERDRQAAWFAQPDGARVLLCSEIGGEGRNFQFCHHLYLFDLPLHPDILEQRIGRLDRIGQKQTVQIHIPYVEDSPEEALARWFSEGLGIFELPWNGATLSKTLIAELRQTLLAFAPRSKKFQERRKLLQKILKKTTEHAAELREQQKASVDCLVDLNSFDEEVGASLAKRISQIDHSPDLRKFMEAAFNHFGIESERIDDSGAVKMSAHSLSFVEHFPGLSAKGELVATYDRTLAMTREELAFVSWEHPVVQGSLGLILDEGVGRVAAAQVKGVRSSKPVGLELLYVLQVTAPETLEVERDLPIQTIDLYVDLDGAVIDPPKFAESALSAIPPAHAAEILSRGKDRFRHAIDVSAKHAQKRAEPIVQKALAARERRYAAERARLLMLAEVNPLITKEEVIVQERKQKEALTSIRSAVPRLDGIRLLVFES